jgi:hypothetical protein
MVAPLAQVADVHAREKLDEAVYFLGQLEKYEDRKELFDYNLSAFVVSWRSVIDIMLYDFAEKFSLNLTRDDYLGEEQFRLSARVLGRKEALDFLKWLISETRKLREKHRILFDRRRVTVHRGKGSTFAAYAINWSPSSAAVSITGSQWVPTTLPTSEYETPPIETQSAEIRFAERPNESAISVCRRAYEDMKILVESTEREAWKAQPSAK